MPDADARPAAPTGDAAVARASSDPRPATVSNLRLRKLVPKADFLRLKRRSNGLGLVFLGGHFAALGATGVLIWLALGTWWMVPAVILHGMVLACLFAPFHEASHHSAFRSNWLNQATLWVTGLLLGNLPSRFTYAHVNHHAYTQDLKLDPQNLAIAEKPWGWLRYGSGFDILKIYAVQLCRYLSPRWIPERDFVYLPRQKVARVVFECRVFWLVYLTAAGVSVWLETWAVVIYWLLPRVAGEWFQSTIRMSEHVGCGYGGEIENRARTVHTWAPLRWLCWNMPYHVEHHAFPNVPFHALPALHTRLKGEHVHTSRSYTGNAWRQLSTAFRRVRGPGGQEAEAARE